MEMALGQYAGLSQQKLYCSVVLYASSVLVKGLGSILTTNNFSDLQNMTKFIFIFALRCKIIKRQLYVFLLKNIS